MGAILETAWLCLDGHKAIKTGMPDSIADQAFYCTVSGRAFEVWVHLRPLTRHNSTPVGLKYDLPSNCNSVSVCVCSL